eukprot:TRINITY_DN15066_c0_g1_i1.p1 TRINITY_DN15066_c0_g1~~TRINITY_DN15066_c0_g1_i1.p1  ORF type:complete len:293 (-),score=43.75 TRINITY_DN15066_c0_g1_i1:41-919(-)
MSDPVKSDSSEKLVALPADASASGSSSNSSGAQEFDRTLLSLALSSDHASLEKTTKIFDNLAHYTKFKLLLISEGQMWSRIPSMFLQLPHITQLCFEGSSTTYVRSIMACDWDSSEMIRRSIDGKSEQKHRSCLYYWQHKTVPVFHYVGQAKLTSSSNVAIRTKNHINFQFQQAKCDGLLEKSFTVTQMSEWTLGLISISSVLESIPAQAIQDQFGREKESLVALMESTPSGSVPPEEQSLIEAVTDYCEAMMIIKYNTLWPKGLNKKIQGENAFAGIAEAVAALKISAETN